MPEQKKGTTQRSGSETEKTVHDLTKQEDLTQVLDRSLRALQEMEQRLQALEQELGSIGTQPRQTPAQRLQGASGASEQYIGAPNPHGLQQSSMPNPFAMVGTQGIPGAWQQPLPAFQTANPYALQAAGYQNQSNTYIPQAAGFHGQSPGGLFGAGHAPFAPNFRGIPASQAGSDPMSQGTGEVPTGAPVSEAMQVGQSELTPGGSGGGTRSKDLADMPPQIRQANMDVVDCKDEFCIHWELPGVKKENLDIMVTDRSLILNAKAFPELDDGVVVHTERPPVIYRRTVPFRTEVDTGKAKANLKDGVLTVRVPKSTPSSGPKHLDVAYG